MKIVRFLGILLVLFIIFIPYGSVYSQSQIKAIEEQIGYAQISPASFFYFLKAFREEIELKTAQSTSVKAVRFLEFATRRIREVIALMYIDREDLIEPALEKYWTHLQDILGSFNLSDLTRNAEIAEQTYQHLYMLNKIYPEIKNNRARIAIRRTITHISSWEPKFAIELNKIHQDDLIKRIFERQQIACDFLEKVASESALNETERSIYIDRASNCQRSFDYSLK